MAAMNLYTHRQTKQLLDHQYAFIKVSIEDHVVRLTLDRPEKKNALHPKMVHEIAFVMHYAHFTPNIWVLEIDAQGDVFCAGADLKAMAGLIEPNDSTIPDPSGEVLMGELFNKIFKPVVVKVTGHVFAGGFFFLAGAHIVIAQEDIILGLPEVKRGLYPFQVMEALLRVMPTRKVIDWCIRGYNLPVAEAVHYGLVTEICKKEIIDEIVKITVEELLQNSPTAINMGLKALDHISPSEANHQYLHGMLQKTIASKDGQEGLSAFREKRKPLWTGKF